MSSRLIHSRSGFRLIRSRQGPASPRHAQRPRYEPRDWRLTFSLILVGILIPHLPLLTLPYFWNEAGYFIPAARELLLTGSIAPHGTVSNAHPPLVMAYLAAWWKLAGFTPLVTRIAMLVISAFALTGVYRLAHRVANREVATAATICTALFPVFFAQSTLAHLDMAAATFTLWGIAFYVEDRRRWCAAMFSLAIMAKETAIIAPLALFLWELAASWWNRRRQTQLLPVTRKAASEAVFLLFPMVPLAAWFGIHYGITGYVFGNPEFFRYNVAATVMSLRVPLAVGQRLWQLTGYLNLYVLTLVTAAAMFLPPLGEGKVSDLGAKLRQRIAVPTQLVFLVVILGYVAALSLIGGALLARYLLPVMPLWIIICVSTLRRRVRLWWMLAAGACVAFVLALIGNPLYRIAPEDTLAYRDFVELQSQATHMLATSSRSSRILTAWPATDELTRPYLGYVEAPFVLAPPLENFSAAQIARAVGRHDYDLTLVFSTKYEPAGGGVMDRFEWWRRARERWFDYHVDLPPEAAAKMLHAHIVWSTRRGVFWAAILQPD